MASASTSSATERVLEYGALNTATPCSRAASRSIWLVPMQKAPTATSLGAASKTSAVSWVRERMPRKCTSAIFFLSSSSGRAPASASTWV